MIAFIQTHASYIVGLLTLISNIIFVLLIGVIIGHVDSRAHIRAFVHRNIVTLIFWGSLVALIGSLAYSEIVGFPPCDLCWVQRIFMYPQVLLAFMAMRKKDKGIVDYLLPFSILGGLVALYQSLIQWGFNVSVTGCTAVGSACAKVYVLEYGYITIPFMSLTVFVYLITLSIVYYHGRKYHESK